MNPSSQFSTTRREFLKHSGRAAAVSALAGVTLPHVHGQEKPSDDGAVKLAVIGCGGRGTGAVQNALSVTGGPIKLVAMADVSESKLKGSYSALQNRFGQQVEVPEDRKFIG